MQSKHRPKQVPLPLSELKKKHSRGGRRKMSVARQRHMEKNNQEKEDIIRGLCNGSLKANAPDHEYTQRKRSIFEMGRIYFEKFQKYYKKKYSVNWVRRLESNKSAMGCMEKALLQVEMLKTSIDSYLDAQFYWTDILYTRAPKYCELCTWLSMTRYKNWIDLKSKNEVTGSIVSAVTAYEMDDASVHKHEISVLDRMIRRWGTEKAVWDMFGDPTCDEVFSRDFKKSRGVWLSIYGGV